MKNSRSTNLQISLAGKLAICLLLMQPGAAPGAFAQASVVREHIAHGNNYLRHLEFQKAIDEYEAALKADPASKTAHGNLLVAHNNWGIYYARQKKYDEAMEQFQKVLKLDPNFNDAKRNISLLKRDMAREEKKEESPVWEPEAESPESKENNEKGKSKEAEEAGEKKPEAPAAVLLTPTSKSDTGAKPNPQSSQAEIKEPLNYGQSFFQSGPSQASKSALSIDEQLSALEMKVYGAKQSELPVIKRLEKLEQDTQGKTNQGTIQERLSRLKASYGLK